MAVELSYCVVNTEQRQLLRYCLDAIARERATVPFETEVLVLDNASGDGSADAARAHPATTELIALDRRRARGGADAELVERARGRFCLLLADDAELEPGATAALHAALQAHPKAGAACATVVRPDGTPSGSPGQRPLWRRLVSGGDGTVRQVRWCRSAAMLVRRDATTAVGSFDPALDGEIAEADLCRRLRRTGWHVLLVPEARAVEHG
jgi:GT2 family glycosyltransferase